MSNYCILTKKKTIWGRKRSHSMNITHRKFKPNLQYHKFFFKNKKIKITNKALRLINKKGFFF